MHEIVHYVTPDGRDVYQERYERLRDIRARTAMERRLSRVRNGNQGDHKVCGAGVWELRLYIGAGYRIYYGRLGAETMLLLCGGDKDSQGADSARAAAYWAQTHKERR